MSNSNQSVSETAHHTVKDLQQVATSGEGLNNVMDEINQSASHMSRRQQRAYQNEVMKDLNNKDLLPDLALVYAKEHGGDIAGDKANGFTDDDLTRYGHTAKLNFLEQNMVQNLHDNYDNLRNAGDNWDHPLHAIADTFRAREGVSADDIDTVLKPKTDEGAYREGATDAVAQLTHNPEQDGSLFQKLSMGHDKITPHSLYEALHQDDIARSHDGESPYLTDEQRNAAMFVKKHYDDITPEVAVGGGFGGAAMMPGDITQDDINNWSKEKLGRSAQDVEQSTYDGVSLSPGKGRSGAEEGDSEDVHGRRSGEHVPGKYDYHLYDRGEGGEVTTIKGFNSEQNAAFQRLAEMSAQDANQGPWAVAARLIGDDNPDVMKLTHQLKSQYQQDSRDDSDTMDTLRAGYRYLTPDNFQDMLEQSAALRQRFAQMTRQMRDDSSSYDPGSEDG